MSKPNLLIIIISLACIFLSSIMTFSAPADEKPSNSTKKLKFETYSGYFVSNKFEPQETTSFVIANNQKKFDQVFGIAFVQRDKSHRLAPDSFKSQIVLAAIRRGKAFYTYQVSSITNKEGILEFRYKAQSKKNATASFACPIIISVPNGNYKAVHFIENDKLLKRIEINRK